MNKGPNSRPPVPTRLTQTPIRTGLNANKGLYRAPIIQPTTRTNDELTYDSELTENVTEYEYLKFVLKKKIEIYNSINTMPKEERTQHLSKFVLYNNFLKNGILTPPDKEKKILTSRSAVIALKQKMKMNIILSIIIYDLKEIFILQKNYLKDDPESFYNKFDLNNEWIYFCICVYDELVKVKKENPTAIIDTNEILKIIEFVKTNKLTYFESFKNLFNKGAQAFFNPISSFKSFMGKLASTTVKGVKYVLGMPTIPPKPDCVKMLFAKFMLILYQYENDANNFPLTINTTNVGDSTKFQEYFDKVVQQQSKYYDAQFGDSIQIAYLTKEIANEKDVNNTSDKLKRLEDELQQLLIKKGKGVTGGTKTRKSKNKGKTRKFRKTLTKDKQIYSTYI
jgi:hypothetical protein